MTFSGEVKEELSRHCSAARHCQLAELAAILHFCGQYGKDKNGLYAIGFQTENEAVVRKGFTLLKKTFNIDTSEPVNEETMNLLMKKLGSFEEPVDSLLLKNACCRRAFLRGAFLSVGSISNPNHGYHLEYVCNSMPLATQLRDTIQSFGIEAKIVQRKKYHVVYLKEGAGIVDLLNVCEAPVALMELENLRIVREVRNSVNRRVNCEAANITKTVNAAAKQIEDIRYLERTVGLRHLPAQLWEMASVRLEHPEASLKELGELMSEPVGKSGVNHRLRKLSEIAEKEKQKRGEKEN